MVECVPINLCHGCTHGATDDDDDDDWVVYPPRWYEIPRHGEVALLTDVADLDAFMRVGLETWSKLDRQIRSDIRRQSVYVNGRRIRSTSRLYSYRLTLPTMRMCTQSAFAPFVHVLNQLHPNLVLTRSKRKRSVRISRRRSTMWVKMKCHLVDAAVCIETPVVSVDCAMVVSGPVVTILLNQFIRSRTVTRPRVG